MAAGTSPTDGNEVPTRSVVVGSIIAIAAFVGSLTFGASLSTFIAHPPLYGWNWTRPSRPATGTGIST